MELPRLVFESITRTSGLRLEPRHDEHRKSKRVPVVQKTVIVPLTSGTQFQPLEVRIRDLSPRGAGLLVNCSLSCGAMFALRLQDSGGRHYWIQCQVQRCQSTGGPSFILGAAFQRVIQTSATPPQPMVARLPDESAAKKVAG